MTKMRHWRLKCWEKVRKSDVTAALACLVNANVKIRMTTRSINTLKHT